MHPLCISALKRFVAVVLLALAVPWAWAQDESQRCVGLRFLSLESGYVTSSDVFGATEEMPGYCRVRARALPAISVEVRLPIKDWNGKYYQTGCGGFCGILGRADKQNTFINAMGPGLKRGYVTATSDGGHHGTSVLDASWADHNPPGERDWGWRSIGETHRVAHALIEAFYERPPERNYFQGCSTGGRMANMAALRYPEMFDGIISGAPAMDYTGLVALEMAWIVQANTDADGAAILKPGKDALIGAEVLRQCDTVDGASDDLIADPRECTVDLTVLQCQEGVAAENCLSDSELTVIAKWRQGPQNAAGELYPGGIPEGSEAFWWLWLTGKPEGGGGLVPMFTNNFGAYMAFADDPGASYSALDFDFEKDPARLAAMGEIYNADAADISAFRDAGGKMVAWHGWADAIVTPYKTVEWYEKLAENMGGADEVGEFVRLFMIPGMDHCGLLPGPGGVDQWSIDPLGALEEWVEAGEAPESIMR